MVCLRVWSMGWLFTALLQPLNNLARRSIRREHRIPNPHNLASTLHRKRCPPQHLPAIPVMRRQVQSLLQREMLVREQVVRQLQPLGDFGLIAGQLHGNAKNLGDAE